MNLPFLSGYGIEFEFSPFYWTLYCKKAPEMGLTLMLRVGPFLLFIYNFKKQDEWYQQLLDRKEKE